MESASNSKILTEPRHDHERNEEDTDCIVAGKTLVEMLDKTLCCRVCQVEVTFLENVNRTSWLLVSQQVKIKCAPAVLLKIFRVTSEYPATLITFNY